MAVVPDDWTPRLASAIVSAVQEFSTQMCGEPVAAFDIGCFPWHGFVELSVLTATELDADPALLEPREVAAWRYYNFSGGVASWTATAELGRRMAEAYYAADDGTRAATAESFMRACALAVASPQVGAALDSFARDQRFRLRVAHPDSGREFWPPGV
jgi:hypothetical protein